MPTRISPFATFLLGFALAFGYFMYGSFEDWKIHKAEKERLLSEKKLEIDELLYQLEKEKNLNGQLLKQLQQCK